MSWAVGHATTGYGIYLDRDETSKFIMAYGSAHEFFEQSYLDDDDDEDEDDERDIDEGAAREGIERDMEGMFLDDDCVTDCDLTDMAGNDYDAMDGLFLFCEKRGSIIVNDASNLYSSMDKLVGELRASYGDCLPSDFDYAGHVRSLCVSREW